MKSFLKTLLSLLVIVIGIGAVVYITQAVQRDLSADDSSALYGGRLEYGYQSAGYLVAFDANGGGKLCGYTALSNRVGLTAGHCVDNVTTMYLGRGEFNTDTTGLLQADNAIAKLSWTRDKIRSDDFAILNFKDDIGYFDEFAEIAEPIEGCHYRVVAYGLTENPTDSAPRKSARLCTVKVDSKTIWVRGYNAGICFGDSGSPVYYNNTNKLVGTIASIIHENPEDAENPCDFNNTAIVVRADVNKDLINENIQSTVGGNDLIDVVPGFNVEVADPSILERLGLSKLESLSDEEKQNYTLIGGIVFVIILMLVGMISLIGGGKKSSY